jgi:hypothetical protein
MDAPKLASYVASVVLHDLASPLQGLMSGAEMAFDDAMGGAMRVEGQKLVQEQIKAITAKMEFMRLAMGSQAVNDHPANIHEGRQLTDAVFAVMRKPKPDWRIATSRITNRQMRLLLNMTYLVKEPAAKNGSVAVIAREDGTQLVLEVVAEGGGPFRPAVLEALAGREPSTGWGGGAAHPLFARILADEIGFTLEATGVAGAAGLAARGPLMG